MRHDLLVPADYNWIFDELDERSPEERERFTPLFYKRMLHANSPLEVALKLLKSDEERRAMMAYLQQVLPTTASPSAPAST